jgi:hypothetical protein
MKKIISLFQRNYDGDRLVRDEIVPGAEWVASGDGVATRKWDGTCCMVRGGKLYRRYDAKHGKAPPVGFEAAQDPDPNTGHWPGWLPVGDGPEDKYHREAFGAFGGEHYADGTYELIGPKINGNPERMDKHRLARHGTYEIPNAPRTFNGLRAWLDEQDIEGIVWHHSDGRMVKIKKKDFGLKRWTPKSLELTRDSGN